MGLNKLVAFSCMSLTLACAGAVKADSFSTGQFVTYGQGDWGSGGVAASLLSADYRSVYASTNEELFVGVVGSPVEYFMEFTSASAVTAYIPSLGDPAPLMGANLLNPTSSPSGIFGGDVVALTLDVDFNNAGFLHGTSSILFGDLILTNFTGSLSGLNGLTVNEFLADANTCLAGGLCLGSLDSVDAVTENLLGSFDDGTVSSFADSNLALPSSGTPTPTPEPSSLLLLAPALACIAFLHRRRILRI